MKKIFLLPIFFFTALTTHAQWDVVTNIARGTPIPSIFCGDNTAIACADSVVFISTDNGISWIQSERIGEADYISAAVKYEDKIFVGTESRGVYESTIGGKNWNPLNAGFSGLGSDVIERLEIRGDSLYAGTMGAGVFVLDLNNSSSWAHFSDGLSFNFSYSIYSLKNINGRLFSGAGISAYYYINEKNSSYWDEYKLADFNSMVIYDFAHYGQYIFMAASLGIFTSTDQGKTFVFTPHNIGAIDVANIAMSGPIIYLAFTKGLRTFWFKSDDFGKTINMIEDQPGITVLSIAIIGDKLFAGRSDGLWFRDLSNTSVNKEPLLRNSILHQNYPNPFNTVTTIEFVIPHFQKIVVKVYDILGNEVSTLCNGQLSAGKHEIEFDAKNLSTGVFVYKIITEDYEEAKKILFIK